MTVELLPEPTLPPARHPGAPAAEDPRPVVGVLALQGDVREHVRALQAAGADVLLVRSPADLDRVDGLVLPGGESTAMGRLLDVSGLLEPVRTQLAAGLPAYGSCAGMVLLADEVVDGLPGQPLLHGLDVTVRRNAFGRQVESFETELPVAGLPGPPVRAVFIRAPWVERVGPGVEVLAEAAGHPVAVRQGDLVATSFHPELTGDPRVHAMFVQVVRSRLRSRLSGTSGSVATAGASGPTTGGAR